MKSLRFIFFLLLTTLYSLLTAHSVNGQKVALVLSGGGSKGAAHIGVLKALEENHIRVDYIVGTSVGAIVGSLYAAGYSPAEIERLFTSDHFGRMVAGVMDAQYNLYVKSEEPNASWVSLDVDFKKKMTANLPSNLVAPYEMDLELMEMLGPAAAVAQSDFNRLMIPFRCVVADVDSSRPVVMRKGDLNAAVRGSMSIPFVFQPITIDGRLAFDGGMYNNFPVDVALSEFNPDAIIGCRVAERYTSAGKDDALSQLLSMLMQRQNDTILFPQSVLITPSLPPVNLRNFSQSAEMIDSGYRATLENMNRIRELVRDTVGQDYFETERERFNGRKPELVFDSVHIRGLNRRQSSYLINQLKHGERYIRMTQLKKYYLRFINEGFIRSVFPMARFNKGTGYYDLYLDIRKTDNFNVQAGGNLSFGTHNEGFAQLTYKYLWSKALHFRANGYFGRFYTSFRGSGRIDFNSRIPWFVQLGYTYNGMNYFRGTTYFFDDKTPTYIIQGEYFGEVLTGIPVTSTGRITGGMNIGYFRTRYYQSNTFSRVDTADQTSFRYLAPLVTFDLNNLNRKQYASAGARFLISLSYINGTEGWLPGTYSKNREESIENRQWFRFRMVYDNYFESLGPVKLGFYGECLFSTQPLFGNYTSSLIYSPAFQPLPDMQSLFLPPFRAYNYAGAGVKTVIRVYKKIDFRLEGYIFQPVQEILESPDDRTAYFGPLFSDRSFLAAGTLVYNTFLGPLSLGVNYYDKTPESFQVSLNFGYILFNPRAIP